VLKKRINAVIQLTKSHTVHVKCITGLTVSVPPKSYLNAAVIFVKCVFLFQVMRTVNYRSNVHLMNAAGQLLSAVPRLISHVAQNLCEWLFYFCCCNNYFNC